MMERVTAIHVFSELNTWIDMLIMPENDMELDRAEKIVNAAYDDWFSCENDSDMPIGDYISSELNKASISHTIYCRT